METEVEVTYTSKQIREHFEKNYNGSPIAITPYEVRLLKKNDCRCVNCDTSVFEMDDYPEISAAGVYCQDCDSELNYDTCPICENAYPKANGPKGTFFVVSKQSAKEVGIKPGFYAVLKYPYYRSCLIGGFESLYEDSVKLIRECDINSMLKKIYSRTHYKISGGECCPDCKDKYCGITPLVNNYVDKKNGAKWVKRDTEIIKQGK